MNKQLTPEEGGGLQPKGARPQEGCTPMVPPMVATAAQLDNMLLLVVGGGDIQALARQLMQTLGSLAAGMVPGAAGATAVSLAPLAAARPSGGAVMAVDGQADPNRAGDAAMDGHADPDQGLQGLPDVLSTPEAMRLWRIAQEQGWVDEHLQPRLDMTKATILASVMADELCLKPRWKPFEMWWKISDMSTRLTRAQYYHSYPETISEYVKRLTMS